MLTADQLGQISFFLRSRAIQRQLVHAQIRMSAVAQAHGSGGARNFFHGDGMGEVAQAGAAVFFLDGETQEPKLA